jgi:hypothetical protein
VPIRTVARPFLQVFRFAFVFPEAISRMNRIMSADAMSLTLRLPSSGLPAGPAGGSGLRLAAKCRAPANGLLVVPEFPGNRSPLAEPDARAVIAGTGLDDSAQTSCRSMSQGLCGAGSGLRQLLTRLGQDDIRIDMNVASGGAAQGDLVRQVLADSTDIRVVMASTARPVLLGAACWLRPVSGHRWQTVWRLCRAPSGCSDLGRRDGRYACAALCSL